MSDFLDISQFNSRAGAAKPSKLHLRNPANFEDLLYADAEKTKPCYVLVLGAEGDEVQRAQKSIKATKLADEQPNRASRRASKSKTPPPEPVDDRSFAEIHEDAVKSAVPLIAGFENIGFEGKALTVKDAETFLNMQVINLRQADGQVSFLEQVLDHASDRQNYLGNG